MIFCTSTPFIRVETAVTSGPTVGAIEISTASASGEPGSQQMPTLRAPTVGPEVIAGSTRMKGGLVQKMILHSLSTSTMVKLGRVKGNLMTNLSPANDKLKERALRILTELSGLETEQAQRLLDQNGGCVEAALQVARKEAM